ncbi:YDG/SRA domain-containing protein [Nocardioides stalactiti]|uniref:YDG/SRA domain-containing protein n=1 Tax=Nocardioides stalactiti TaxID=2755356 RepID=UPI001C80F339|nr:YDG/SRA domain-containing protein [Nocardioides stalactiti]
MTTYVFGEIPGNPVGTTYADRGAAMRAGVHQVQMQGISGNGHVGANSIVVSGGYADDEDHGDVIIYTGAGGNDTQTKTQIDHQSFSQHGNAGLILSEENGLPVRVIRGSGGDPLHSPATGFRYDGLYRVESHWYETGLQGYRICRYRLVKLSPSEAEPYSLAPGDAPGSAVGAPGGALVKDGAKRRKPGPPPLGAKKPSRNAGVQVRVVRDTAVSHWVKELYGYACQICDQILDLPVGNYAEGAHIRPLGAPHHGPDTVDNMLCLCPTHHVLFDKGAIVITDDLGVLDHHGHDLGTLTVKAGHLIYHDHFRHHRDGAGF